MKGKFIFLANGFEETEALATLDVLRRGGLDVKTVSITDDKMVTSSHKVTVEADMIFKDFLAQVDLESTVAEDLMIFPGGMPGTKNLAAHEELMDIMKKHYSKGGLVAAICAAPGLVASQLPDLEGKKFTCFAGFEPTMVEKGAKYLEKPVVVDGNLITGRGAGWAVEFGMAILKYIKDEDAEKEVRKGMMLL